MARCPVIAAGRRCAATLAVAAAIAWPAAAPAAPDEERAPGHVADRLSADRPAVTAGITEMSVEEVVELVASTTGKAVMPASPTSTATLMKKKVSIVNGRPLGPGETLDLLFIALRANGIGVIEHDDRIVLVAQGDIDRMTVPVLGPDEPLTGRFPSGTWVTKVFRLHRRDARDIHALVERSLNAAATDGLKVEVDQSSNAIVVVGSLDLCRHAQRVIETLDVSFAKTRAATFRLAHADAVEVVHNITALFAGARTGSAATDGADPAPGAAAQVRAVADVAGNAVTVSGDPADIAAIAALIENDWDLPRTTRTTRTYELAHADPARLRDMLGELLPSGAALGIGGAGDALEGVYRIETDDARRRLVVIARTPEVFAFLDSMVADLDQPAPDALPMIVELAHADAEEVADQINLILAPDGTRVDLPRRPRGLTGLLEMPGTATPGGTEPAGTIGTMTFPWQQARPHRDATPQSAMIGRVRAIPIHHRNAVLILAAREHREMLRRLIRDELDAPRRQVRISAVLAEVEWSDELALGWRLSDSDAIHSGAPVDNRVGARGTIVDPLIGLADGVHLEGGVNLVLQALRQRTRVRILQSPSVFTADARGAAFFEGQEVPVLATTQTTPQQTVNETVNYLSVGVGMAVRPHITASGDVDLEISVSVSNLAPARVQLNSPVIGRREAATRVIVQDGQTVVLSGILRDMSSRVQRGLPVFKDLPLLGGLFRYDHDVHTRTELLVFITPVLQDARETPTAGSAQVPGSSQPR